MITWITENVAIGEYMDAIDEALIKQEKIDCVLNLRVRNDELIVEETFELCSGPHYYHISVGNHKGLEPIKIELRTAAYMLEQLTRKYKRILVHCTAGIDRAPFVVAYWMAGYSGDLKVPELFTTQSFDFNFWMKRSYELIKEKRPQVKEHYEWI